MGGRSSERDRLIARIDQVEQRIQQLAIRYGAFGAIPNDLTLQQLRVLGLLGAAGPQTSHDLADAADVGPTTLTGIVDRLEGKEYVRRQPDPHDRRVRRVELTDHGSTLLAELNEVKRDHQQRVLARLHRDDLRKLAEGFEAFEQAFEADSESTE